MVFRKLTVDAVNRAAVTCDGVAGKSINVAKVLRALGATPVAAGFLGDDSSPGKDRDGFRFAGKAGEKITATLAPSRSGGGSGETARLVLRDGSGRRLATDAGALPLELTTTLPAAGTYVVAAIKAEPGAGKPFRGHFLLTVRSNAGRARGESLLLGATGETEP